LLGRSRFFLLVEPHLFFLRLSSRASSEQHLPTVFRASGLIYRIN
jgi:hypothetical protein